ncbi:C4-dicarboxylate ABC transporter [Helicobacter winghamensis]|uniref:C4-dicarboxylate ABC transporter n=1 Tax=Helicobacter winghamensis TaxID=157268 RepID=A0A2N3PIV5_9HELI|nr:TRAP transporter large permease subunit [Helicobacter winghamensis]EEO25282.1 TRAP transporter, DctM subunit [Helicobacter winghamensis ATCC BAA-430]PKT76324.1 C4-dicarboxylate ABC transporter [Helicobacter winghamensis]PKT76455.1 C4-dicarboxylate ABC transporter [Helicobacter winghamensis]PKT76586.1 C4-dicarboxylate ABC transporter [Helicobacter winghamensis]PKT80835.1 C4-dicarboxylate ABC transporter [Helicobacter winghamensis]
MELLALVGIAIFLLILGVPVAFAFGSSGLFVGSYLMLFGDNPYVLTFLPNRLEGIFSNATLISIPLFILMGMILERSGIAERLINSIAKLFGSLGGGAAIGVILVGVLLAASTGIVGATVVMMGVIAVPTMLKAGYNKSLVSGVVAASGTLGQIIPPSIILIILADVLHVSVRDLFSAAILPSAILVGLYILFVLGVVIFAPKFAPASPDHSKRLRALALEALKMAIPPIVLIMLVLGSILTGLVEPTQAAAIGVVGALLLAFLNGRLDIDLLKHTGKETIIFCGMVFMILIGANCFTLVFNALGGDVVVLEFFSQYLNSPFYFMLVAMLVIFILGFLIDFFEICYIALPILAGIAMHYQIDMLWFALLVAINLQTSFLTPPFGFSIFFLKSAVGDTIKIGEIYKGVIPFIILQILVLGVVFLFPQLTLTSDDWAKILEFIF